MNMLDSNFKNDPIRFNGSESEERFSFLLKYSNTYYWEQNVDYCFTLIQNGNSYEPHHFLQKLIGKALWELEGMPEAPNTFWSEYKEKLLNHEPFKNFLIKKSDLPADEFSFSISGDPMFDAEEKFKGYRGFIKKITSENVNESYLDTINLLAVGISHVDTNGKFIHVNEHLCDMLGYCPKDLLQLTVTEITHPDDNNNFPNETRTKLRSGEIDSFKFEKRYLRKDSSPIWVAITVSLKRDPDGAHLHDVALIEDISIRKEAEERVQYLANYDEMTGLPNRILFSQLIQQAIKYANRYDRKFAIFFIDLDRFKQVNDSLGHTGGDRLLIEMAKRFKNCLRASDIVARLGGDEFVVLVQEVEQQHQVATVANNILSTSTKPVKIMDMECRVTASIGICMYPDGADDEKMLMQNADMAMYHAKDEGKNNFQYYSKEMKYRSQKKMELESYLQFALELNEFEIKYQPRVNVESGKICGAEALLRWYNPTLGQVSPARFIPVAEEMGLIVSLGKWVIRSACEQLKSWQESEQSPICISINISPRQFMDTELIRFLKDTLQATGVSPELIELEVTEGIVMRNIEQSLEKLNQIKGMGIKIAIDDFGTGYSSLSQLKRFPVDTLKIDGSFVHEIPNNKDDMAITEAIVVMSKLLGITSVAEGVETREQYEFLKEHDCDEIQGFYFSKAISPQHFEQLLLEDKILI